VDVTSLLSVSVDTTANTQAPGGELPGDPDAAIRQLYSHCAKALHGYVEHFCPDQASADDIVQETFIRGPASPALAVPGRAIPDTATAVVGVLLAVPVWFCCA
jgi:Sigma-70 region 2